MSLGIGCWIAVKRAVRVVPNPIGPPVVPFFALFGWKGSPTKNRLQKGKKEKTKKRRKKTGTLIPTSLQKELQPPCLFCLGARFGRLLMRQSTFRTSPAPRPSSPTSCLAATFAGGWLADMAQVFWSGSKLGQN